MAVQLLDKTLVMKQKRSTSVKTIERLRQEDKDLNSNIDNLKNKILYNSKNEI